MNIKTNKKFIKDLDSISDPFVFKQVKLVNDILCKIENIQMIPSCKKIV
jgi:hypothetical protein